MLARDSHTLRPHGCCEILIKCLSAVSHPLIERSCRRLWHVPSSQDDLPFATDRGWSPRQTCGDRPRSLLCDIRHHCYVRIGRPKGRRRRNRADVAISDPVRLRRILNGLIAILSTGSLPFSTRNTGITGQYGSSAARGPDIPTKPYMDVFATIHGPTTTLRRSG